MHRAAYYEKINGGIRCSLCPHHCEIKDGSVGLCKVRKNISGDLMSMNYGIVSATNLDRIEKKPLYHYYPGKMIYSIGSIGCNLRCLYCQNHSIAQGDFSNIYERAKRTNPKSIIEDALRAEEEDSIGIAYTYNEPTVWYEYMKDIAIEAREKGLKNIMVSNGYIEEKPLEELLGVIDAFSIDLKGYSDEFYRKVTGSTLAPVKRTLEKVAKSSSHLEVEYLVIPGENDDTEEFERLIKWYKNTLGRGVPLHINRYFPHYKMTIEQTPVDTLIKLFEIAKKYLDHVYIGNVGMEVGRDTYCSKCGKKVIDRRYSIDIKGLEGGRCTNCDKTLEGEGYE